MIGMFKKPGKMGEEGLKRIAQASVTNPHSHAEDMARLNGLTPEQQDKMLKTDQTLMKASRLLKGAKEPKTFLNKLLNNILVKQAAKLDVLAARAKLEILQRQLNKIDAKTENKGLAGKVVSKVAGKAKETLKNMGAGGLAMLGIKKRPVPVLANAAPRHGAARA